MGRKLALIRGINVGGRVLPMAELREICAGLGWHDVRTFIQSGNVVFESDESAAALEAVLEAAISERFGFKVPVIVRTPAQWADYPLANPFPKAAEDEPNRLLMLLSKGVPTEGAEDVIQARAVAGERVKRAGDALWFRYPEGVGTSKLTPSLIDRALGSAATGRNYRTVVTLLDMLRA